MSSALIIGLVFLGILIAFLIITFFTVKRLEESQYNTLHFLTSLCAGFAGGFLSGEALLSIDGKLAEGIRFTLSGTSGFAMFFLIWFKYPKRHLEPLKDAFHFSVPPNWTFNQTVRAIAKANNSIVQFIDFDKEDLDLELDSQELHEREPIEAIKKLKALNRNIPDYSIQFLNNTFVLKKN